jgi:ATP-binding cassette subfamily B (MDR/TAP) protein 1
MLDLKSDMRNGSMKPRIVRGDIEFRNVSFSYPVRPDTTVLDDLSLTIPNGKHYALVGSSGSGKTTILGLVERFYDPSSGSIYLDGNDIRLLDSEWLRKNIALVSQEPHLFNTTIRKNITYAVDRKVSMEEIIQVAKYTHCHNFIVELPDQYDTVVGEGGSSLSVSCS